MRTIIVIAVAALSSAFAVTASAWPVEPIASDLVGPKVHLIQHKSDKKPPPEQTPKKNPPPKKYKAGDRYDDAPKGWRKHGKRPKDWKTRGCVIVGPVWFCP